MGEIKICKKCKEELDVYKFRGQNKTLSDGTVKRYARSYCRKCEKKIYYKEDGFHYVYYLPEHHYAGMTCNIKRRMRQHRENGLIIAGYEIVGKHKRSVDAHLLETMLHVRGYYGYHERGGIIN